MSLRRTFLTVAACATTAVLAVCIPVAASGAKAPKSSRNILLINSSMIKDNSITSLDIKNYSIATKDLVEQAVNKINIANNAVGLTQLSDDVMAEVRTIVDQKITVLDQKIAALKIPAAPRAYGRVKADGAVDSALSSNLAARRKTSGKYCVSVTGVSDASKIAPVVTAVNDTTENIAVISSMIQCNTNEFGVAVLFTSMEEDGAFNVYVP